MNPNETLSSHDRLAMFGFGVFETLLVAKEGPLFVDLHWQRMKKGADLLGLRLPDIHEWFKQLLRFIELTPNTYPYALRITLSGGAPATGLPSQLLFHKRLIPYTPAQHCSGIRLHLLANPRNEKSPLVCVKSTNYLENILAKEEATRTDCQEGLWLNTQGYICEGTMSNLFFIKDMNLFTPCLSCGCLPGTRRQIFLDIARFLNIPAYEGFYTFSDLSNADEIFLTNSLMGLMPVRQVDNFPLKVLPTGCKTSGMRQLELAYRKLIGIQSSSFYNPLL
jgi:Branched-chain amino acid aminotransferase/4-amino-4-deoxychorismate lyase